MSKLSIREKRMIIFAIVFIVGFSLFNWVIKPLWTDYMTMQEELREAKRAYLKAVSVTNSESSLLAQHTAYSEAYQEVLSHFYANLGEQEVKIKFLALVEELIEKTNVNIVSKNIAAGSKEEGFKTVKINLTVKGTPDQMADLLLALRNAPIVTNVDRIRVDVDQRNRLLQMRLTVSTTIIEEVGDQDGTEK